MPNNKENTALAVQAGGGYLALANNDFSTTIGEVLDGLNISLPKAKIQGSEYEVPNEDGDTEMVKEISAVILHNHPLNMYYKTEYSGGNAPPDCGSMDGKFGVGDPGGDCKRCPLNQFGTAKSTDGKTNGKGKACKNRQRVYVLREGELFPMVLSLPTGSLTTFGKFLTAQLSKGRRPQQYITRFTLKRAQSSEGKPYSQAQFKFERALTPEEMPLVAKMAEQVKEFSATVGYDNHGDVFNYDEDNPYVDAETGEVIEPLGR